MNDGASKSNRSNAPTERPALPKIKTTINLDELQNDSPTAKVEKKKKRNITRKKQSSMGKTMRDNMKLTIPPHAKDDSARVTKK